MNAMKEYRNSCRLCRKSCRSDGYPLNVPINGVSISEMLSKTIPISLYDPVSQLLPQKICHDCFETVTKFYEFQKFAIECDEFYRNFVNNKAKEVMEVDENPSVCDESSRVELKTSIFNPKFIFKDSITKRDLYICSFCDFSHEDMEKVRGHIANRHDPLIFPFYCEYCLYRFKDVNLRDEHQKSHTTTTKKIHVCEICNVTGKILARMDYHKVADHGLEPKIINEIIEKNGKYCECDLCGTQRNTKIGIEHHILHDHLPQDLKCEKCDEKFNYKKDFLYHKFTVHEKMIKALEGDKIISTLKCALCEAPNSTLDELLNHLNIHKNEFQRKRNCKLCSKSLRKFREFVRHNKFHTIPATHQCLKCMKKFELDERCFIHCKNHKEEVAMPQDCEICKVTFENVERLKAHQEIWHKREEPKLKCSKCGRKMKDEKMLKEHFR